jgi:TolB-like protein/cytochrome c-type biogenesis protein CcmH/NrfG
MNFISELQRRNVFRVGFAYAVVGWLVAQVADMALESFGAPDWVMKTALFFMVVGFVLSLFIAWAYELTPEGIKRAEDVDPNASITQQTGRKLDRLVIVILFLAVSLLVFDRYRDKPVPTTPPPQNSVAEQVSEASPGVTEQTKPDNKAAEMSDEPSVAVLPFVNMSSDPEQEYFSDGISEEILNVLTRIPNLKVAARTSSFQFKGKNLDIADIGQRLQVNHLLEGSVRKSGSTLRITAQLVESNTGFHLWSETYDRKLEDVFAIQDEIAAAIATNLRTLFADQAAVISTPVDMKAYELYLRGRGLVATRIPAEMHEGMGYLKQALEIEPEYPSAMATLAKANVLLPFFSTAPVRESREQARELALKALEIDAQNVEALAVLGLVYNEFDIDPGKSIELLEKAVTLNPGSVVANNFLGDVYFRITDFDKALKYELRAAELDPLGPIHLTDLASISLVQGDYQGALRLANRALALDSTFLHALIAQTQASYFLGDTEQIKRVIKVLETLPDVDPGRVENVRSLQALAEGKRESAKLSLQKNAQPTNGKRGFVYVAQQAIQLGDFDTAGQMLLKALDEKDGRWIYPLLVRMPEQAPDSEPWQEFWRQPGPHRVAELRRANGFTPHAATFGSGANP